MVIRLTKEFSFEAAHVLEGYDGKCSQIHGHSYRLQVTVSGEPCRRASDPKEGMTLDFGELKRIVNGEIVDRLDHSLVVRRGTEGDWRTTLKSVFANIVETDYQPTCENMLSDFAVRLRDRLPQGVMLHSLRMYETATSYAEWYAEDNPR